MTSWHAYGREGPFLMHPTKKRRDRMYRKPTWSSRAPDMGCSKEENQQGALCSKTAGGMSNHLALGSCDCVLLKHWSKLCLQAASAAAFTHKHWALGCCSSGTCRAFYHAPTPAPLLHRLNCPLLHRFTVPCSTVKQGMVASPSPLCIGDGPLLQSPLEMFCHQKSLTTSP